MLTYGLHEDSAFTVFFLRHSVLIKWKSRAQQRAYSKHRKLLAYSHFEDRVLRGVMSTWKTKTAHWRKKFETMMIAENACFHTLFNRTFKRWKSTVRYGKCMTTILVLRCVSAHLNPNLSSCRLAKLEDQVEQFYNTELQKRALSGLYSYANYKMECEEKWRDAVQYQ